LTAFSKKNVLHCKTFVKVLLPGLGLFLFAF